jgi:hypothetical protein
VLAKQGRLAEANEAGGRNTEAQNQKDDRRHSRHGLSPDGRARAKAHENKEEVARSCLAFDEAEHGVIVRKAEKVLDKCPTRKSELEGVKVKGRTRR